MHYYKRNLGDYAKKAGRLSMLQHGSYTLLIDSCYDREQFPTLEEAIEWTWASTTEEVEAVTFVLRKFFTLENGVYVQKRIQEEIAEYHGKAETNKRIAIERETKRKENNTKRAKESTNREQDVNEAPPNHKPLTNNHKPIEQTHTVEDCNVVEVTEIGRVCLAIKSEFDLQNKQILDINQSNPTLIALVDAGATPEEFADAAKKSATSGKGFSYLLGIVKRQREEAAKLNLHRGAMPNAPPKSINQSRSDTASEMFKMFKKDSENANDNTRIIDISDYTTDTDRPLISTHG
jgi:uncharacterized protein YdaU (DUF1376 family)